jgi:hypothetical protein
MSSDDDEFFTFDFDDPDCGAAVSPDSYTAAELPGATVFLSVLSPSILCISDMQTSELSEWPLLLEA